MTEYLNIPVAGSKDGLMLMVYPQSKKAKVFEENDLSSGESRWQLVEGEEYEYEFTQESYAFKTHELVSPSKSNASRGLIKTGVYVGCLTLKVVDAAENEIGEIEFEVRSVKVDYKTDYKTMLHDITRHFTELVMMQGAPVTQRFEVDPDEDSRTLYQQFAFMKSLIDSEEFEDALNKILYNPIRKWTGTMIEKDICSVKRLGRHELKQVASSKNRIPLDERCRIDTSLPSVPRRITVPYKKDTVDVAENQFVKFVLLSFSSFCSVIQQCKNATQRLKNEAELTNNKLAALLNNNFFREISNLQIASLNSPALQRCSLHHLENAPYISKLRLRHILANLTENEFIETSGKTSGQKYILHVSKRKTTKEKINYSLKKRQTKARQKEAILRYLDSVGKINNPEARELLKLEPKDVSHVSRLFKELLESEDIVILSEKSKNQRVYGRKK